MSEGLYVDHEALEQLACGLSGVIGDLCGVAGQIRGGDPGAAGHPALASAISGFQSGWGVGLDSLHEALGEFQTRMTAASSSYAAADSAVASAFRR